MFRLLIINIYLVFHPIHVTLTTITGDVDSDSLKVFFRMYYDDFQLDYKLYYPDFSPGDHNDTSAFPKEMLSKYFNSMVNIYVNRKLLSGTLSDVSIDNYEIRLNLTYTSVKNPRTIRVSNKILTTIYSDQANMVYLSIEKYEDAVKLTVEQTEKTIILR